MIYFFIDILISSAQVQSINKKICQSTNAKYHCYDGGKIDSALHSAFYPGVPPFQHGGISRVAGAMAYYILKAHAFFDGNKRTALLASSTFLALNGFSLQYPMPAQGWSEFAVVLDKAAANLMSMAELKEWFDLHKIGTSLSK